MSGVAPETQLTRKPHATFAKRIKLIRVTACIGAILRRRPLNPGVWQGEKATIQRQLLKLATKLELLVGFEPRKQHAAGLHPSWRCKLHSLACGAGLP
jgi:hypothetical protein